MESINLNLIPTGANPVVHVSQYDTGRVIRFNIFEGSSVYFLDGTETISCNIKKPDNNIVTLSVTNTNDSYVEITTTEQATACDGSNLCEISITKGDDVIGSLNFIMEVERSPIEGGISSASEINNLWTQVDGMVADALATQYDSANVVFDNIPTAGHGIPYTVTSEGIGNAIDNALDMTDTASGSIATFESEYALPLRDLEIEINAVETGDGNPKSPSNPYTISGFTGANIKVVGSNLWNEDWEAGGLNNNTGEPTTSNRIRSKNFMPITPNTQIRCVENGVPNTEDINVFFYDKNQNFISHANWATTPTTPANCFYFKIHTAFSYGVTYKNDISINYPATDTAYHAYNPNSTTTAITWLDEAGTVYGGSLDVTSGKLTVTHAIITLDGTETWTEHASGKYFASVITNNSNLQSATGYLSNIYDFSGNGYSRSTDITTDNRFYLQGNYGRVWIYDSTISDLTALQTMLTNTPMVIVYPLATPTIYQLTPTQISAIVGTNNIFTDTNGDTTLEYYTKRGEQTVHISEATAKEVINSATFGNLDTTDKTIVGAINEVNGMFEQGSSGKFTYRKWRNGVLEIWGNDHNNTWAPTWTAWGDGFFTTIASIGSYPIAFVDEPSVTVSLQPKGGQTFAGITDGNFANRYTQAPSIGAYRFTTDGGTLNEYVLSIYAIGKWKN